MLDISIPKEDLDAITYWRERWIDDVSYPTEKLLRPWEAAKKEYLYKMFGEQLILQKKINKQTPAYLRVNYFEENITTQQGRFLYDISHCLQSVVENYIDHPISHIFLYPVLVRNIYEGPNLEIKYHDEILRINNGMKIMKIIRKLMTLFNFDTPYYQDIFDEIRQLQSMANNKADFYGDLCISIHPLDYMTMSDNSCDWESCMRWNYGDYRLGTVEMMNSPCVVVGYLKSKTPFYLDGEPRKQYFWSNKKQYPWSNKKWRSLFVVTKDCIAAVKGYPYQSEELTDEILAWLKELAETNLNWKYDLGAVVTENNHHITDKATGEILYYDRIHFETEFMYNDFYTLSEHSAYLNSSIDLNEPIYYSGDAQCMKCGDIIDFEDRDYVEEGGSLICGRCLGTYRYCEECGDRLPADDDFWYYTDNGEGPFCECCFNELTFTCPFTGSTLIKEDSGKSFYFVEKDSLDSTLEEDIKDVRRMYYNENIDLEKRITMTFEDEEVVLFKRKFKDTTEYLVYIEDWRLARGFSGYGTELLTASEKKEFELNFKAGEFKPVT